MARDQVVTRYGAGELLFEFIEFGLEVLRPRDFVGPRHFVEGVTNMREGCN